MGPCHSLPQGRLEGCRVLPGGGGGVGGSGGVGEELNTGASRVGAPFRGYNSPQGKPDVTPLKVKVLCPSQFKASLTPSR